MTLVFPRLYAIIDSALLRTSELAVADMLAQAGVALMQYRDKRASPRRLLDVSQQLQAQLAPHGARLVVNDRADVACLAGAAGVHVGQDDLPVDDARRILGPAAWVGISTHNLHQVRAAESTSADYVAFGPVFATATKEHAEPVVGLSLLREARRQTRKPLVAIGGITLERVGEVFDAGADCVAVARDLVANENPGARARDYLARLANV